MSKPATVPGRIHRVRPPFGRPFTLFLVALVVLAGSPPLHASEPPPTSSWSEEGWTRDLTRYEPPYDQAKEVTAMVLSEDGRILVLGTDNGGVIFHNATSGSVLEAWETSSHGAVQTIHLDAEGGLAALVYTDGYVAVVGWGYETPLLTLDPDDAWNGRTSATLSPDGRFLVVAKDAIELYHRDTEKAPYTRIDSDANGAGPFVWFHKKFLFFGALAPDGEVTLYAYGSKGLSSQGTRDITDGEGTVTALAVSGDGNRFAVALDSGSVVRYTPSLNPASPQLIPGYKGSIQGAPTGIALDGDGMRLAAWSGRELLWVDGCNQNIEALCDGKTTEKDTVRLRPPIGTSFATAATTPDQSRALVQIDGDSRERRLYNLPSLDHFVMEGEATGTGRSLLDPTGAKVFLTDGTAVQADRISPRELPPSTGVQITTGTDGDDGDGFRLWGLSTEVLLFGGIGILALLLLAVLVSVGLAMRRSTTADRRGAPLPSLAPMDDTPLGLMRAPPTGGGGAVPGRLRTVVPSAPAATAPPEGLLVLQDVVVPAPALSTPLALVVRRAEVLRVVTNDAARDAFVALLSGASGFHGVLAVGGASAAETPVLFRRRVRVGLGAPPRGDEDAAALFRRTAEARGLPMGLVERRMQKDLGWMGDRLGRPYGSLRPLDQWKVRIALILVDRPHLVALDVADLPWEGGGTKRRNTLRLILSGIARHYDTLVLLLDEGGSDEVQVRALADEEVTLGPGGFTERRLLAEGRAIAADPERKTATRGAGRPFVR